jgi:lysophospholipase L1-like esterase
MQEEPTPAPLPVLPARSGPGPVVRALGRALPGVREVGGHILDYGTEWDRRTRAAIDTDAPLWVALGDSTAQGIGASTIDGGYVAQLYRQRPLPSADLGLVNISVSGARIDDVLRRQLPVLDALRPRVQLVTCSIGSNDLTRSPNARRITGSLRRLFAALEGLPTVAVATLPIGSLSLAGRMVNTMIRREAPLHGLVVADVQAAYQAPYRGKMAPDRFHPNAAGYEDWATAFVTALDW